MKKILSIFLLLFLCFTNALSQDNCGTPDISEADYLALPWYGNEAFLVDFYDSLENAMSEPAQRNLQDEDIKYSGKLT